MGTFTQGLQLVRKHYRAYFALNFIYYSLIAIAMLVVTLHPDLQQMLNTAMQRNFQRSLPAGGTQAYQSGNIPKVALWTFGVNSVGGSFASITLPSLIVPFSGMLLTALRMVL